MKFDLSEEEILIKNESEKFSKILYENARKYEKEGVPSSLYNQYKELGFLTIDWPENLGGQNLPFFVKSLVLEELSKGCASSTFHLDRACFAIYPLLHLENSEAKEYLLSKFKNSEEGFEPAVFLDSDARFKFENGKLSGKIFYIPCHRPSILTIIQNNRIFIIEENISSNPVIPCALHSAGACEVEVNGKPLLYEEINKNNLRKILASLRLYISSYLLGVSRASFEYSLKYTQERVVFGKKVAHHQAIAFILADMSTYIESTRLYIWKAAWVLTKGDGFEDASLAFIQSQECSSFVSNFGVQLLGGHGYIKDHPVEKWMREARTIPAIIGGKDLAQIDLEQESVGDWVK